MSRPRTTKGERAARQAAEREQLLDELRDSCFSADAWAAAVDLASDVLEFLRAERSVRSDHDAAVQSLRAIVVHLLCWEHGLTEPQIAERLGIGLRTVERAVALAQDALRAKVRTQERRWTCGDCGARERSDGPPAGWDEVSTGVRCPECRPSADTVPSADGAFRGEVRQRKRFVARQMAGLTSSD
jgi:hypothetical protein